MKNIARVIVSGVVLGTAGCLPDPVDPDATFTIEGKLIDAAGAPDADVEVQIIKVESWLGEERHLLLDYQDLDDFIDELSDEVFKTQSNADGEFSIELEGRQVNNDGGGAAAYLAVVYQTAADPDLTTATEWFHFSDADPTWEAGDLKLWNGASATATATDVTFTKGSPPEGNSWDADRPTFSLAYTESPTTAGDYFLEWGGHTYGSSLVVPRSAFTGTNPPGYVMIARSEDGSRGFEHRSSYLAVPSTSWSAAASKGSYFEAAVPAVILDKDGTAVTGADGSDGDLGEPWLTFATDTKKFYVDLGSVQVVTDILVYNLVVTPSLNAAVLTIDISSDAAVTGATWENLLSVGPGSWELQNWVYLGWTGTNKSARFVRIAVDDSSGRSLHSVAEVEVLAP